MVVQPRYSCLQIWQVSYQISAVASEALGIGDYTEIDRSPIPGKGSYNDSCLKNTSSKVTKEVAGTNASIQVDLENRREDII